ncbi:hypothetical protein [Leucobacter ruminantium]|uniref:Uncharacterized protein n=1 Tax=Leucobacter ruminantium TaxID=1289170 RepID=A0A939LW33_9MICO|nr:hypothetical protein [Leucobacter ruminantium]MBO1805834.1 hypothetical protein [Leucobacter ruminantium]
MELYSWAELGGVRLHGAPAGPDPFSGLMLSRLIGWRGLPGARGESDAIPDGNGDYAREVVLREGRSMELRGAAIGATAYDAALMLDELEAAIGGRTVELRVCDSTGEWTRMVEVEMATPAEAWNRPRVPFALDLIAPDPIRYRDPVALGPVGLPVREGGLRLPKAFPWNFGTSIQPSVLIVNEGTAPVFPVVRVVGAASALVVHGGPRRVEVGSFSGELVIDNRDRRVWLNGADVTRYAVRRDWHEIPAGGTAEFFFVASGPSPDLVMTVEYQIGVW